MILLSFCSFPWWLLWLLPFLLGLLVGWGLWSKYKSKADELESDLFKSRKKASTLEGELASCNARRAEIESELALVKGRLREMEAETKLGVVGGLSGSSQDESDSNGDESDSGSSSDDSADEGESSDFNVSTDAPENSGEVTSKMGAVAGAIKRNAEEESGSLSIYSAIKSDNLQIIEGIGPKMESVLKDNGVNTLVDLAGKSPAGLRELLDKYGDKYRIIDPGTWPSQAELAAVGKWEQLIEVQKHLDTGRSERATASTDSKVEKVLIKMGVLKKWAQDDLRAVEGIGPKIAGLLKDDGIDTWRALSETTVDKIQGILTKAGKRYQLADPSTWPKQAEMAADGKWDELRAYQDRLKGGKE